MSFPEELVSINKSVNRAQVLAYAEASGDYNPIHVDECQTCGTSFKNDFTIKLEDALRLGGIARGMDLTEEEVRLGEEIAEQVREGALQQGDEVVLRLIRQFPPESLARIKKLLDVG